MKILRPVQITESKLLSWNKRIAEKQILIDFLFAYRKIVQDDIFAAEITYMLCYVQDFCQEHSVPKELNKYFSSPISHMVTQGKNAEQLWEITMKVCEDYKNNKINSDYITLDPQSLS